MMFYIAWEALNNSSVNHSPGANDSISPEGVSLMDETSNDQSKNKSKYDFDLFFIFNNLAVIKNHGYAILDV